MVEKIIKILIVEDHKLIRVGIKSVFDEAEGYDVIAEAETAKEAINKAKTHFPDVILLDLGLPDMSGIKAISELSSISPNSKIIILSSHYNEDEIQKSLSLGAFAYVIKDINT